MKSVALSEITATLESGARPAAGVTDQREIPSLGGEQIAPDGSIREDKLRFITKGTYESLRSGKLKHGDVLIVKDGATTGKTAFYTHLNGFSEAALNEHVFLLRVSPDRATSKFVYWFLRSERGQAEILKDFRGATVGGISRGFTNKVSIPLPPVAEQKRIAGILDAADALRAKRREALAQLDTLLQATFVDLFGDPVTNPKGLRQGTLGTVFSFTTGKLDSNAAVAGGTYPFFTCAREDSSIDHYAFDCEALILSGNNASADYSVKHFKGKFNAYQRTYIISVDESALSYEYARLALEYLLSDLKRFSKGTNTKYLTLGILNRMQLLLPSLDDQKRFTTFVRTIERQKSRLRAHLAELDTLFASLQSRAFRGEL